MSFYKFIFTFAVAIAYSAILCTGQAGMFNCESEGLLKTYWRDGTYYECPGNSFCLNEVVNGTLGATQNGVMDPNQFGPCVPDQPCDGSLNQHMAIKYVRACSYYYYCDDSLQRIAARCPTGFHFDKSTEICDYAEVVKCDPNYTGTTTSTAYTTTVTPSTRTYEYTTTATTPWRPWPTCNVAELQPDPRSCQHYYGYTKYKCPNGMTFDTHSKRCQRHSDCWK